MTAEENHEIARASAWDDEIAAERGRLFALRNMIEDPETRKKMEERFGLSYCRNRYPEAYAVGKRAGKEWKPVIKLIPGMGEPIS